MDLGFKEYLELTDLTEGISIQNGELIFDYKSKDGTLQSKLGKGKAFKPFRKKDSKSGHFIYSVYNVKDLPNAPTLKAIKSGVADTADYRYFLKRTSIFITSRIFKDIKPDVVITPASTSYILNDLIDELKKITPQVKFLKEKFKKVLDPNKIVIDYNNPKITPAIIKGLEQIIKRGRREGYFQIKWAHKQFAPFISNFFDLVDDYKWDKLNGQNVVLLDDVISSGTTFQDMLRIIGQYAPKSITGVTIFKTKG